MKLVKQTENGTLIWIDTEGYREHTQAELEAREERLAVLKAEDEKRKRISLTMKNIPAES